MSDNQRKPDGETEISDNRQKTNSLSFPRWFYLSLVGSGALLFLSTVVALSLAEFYGNLGFSKFLAVILITEVVAAIVIVSVVRSNWWAGLFQQKKPKSAGSPGVPSKEDHESTSETEEDKWLLRLVLVTALGMCIVIVYAEQWLGLDAITIAGVGLLTAGAAWLIAAVVGFVFGIPHREYPSNLKAQQEAEVRQEPDDKLEQTGVQNVGPNAIRRIYEGSTSLEQVSDWLTKIIVGVGLTQLNKIPTKLNGLAAYIASGMGSNISSNTSNNRVFALSICVYFSSCGFLFGYLWARLLLLKAFERAEPMEKNRANRSLASADQISKPSPAPQGSPKSGQRETPENRP